MSENKPSKPLLQNPKQRQIYTQIQGGKFKGKKLLLPSLSTTRSTKSIVKQCVFNVLSLELKECIFIEAFAGSGAMALEALSRGAKKAYAIEKDKNAYEIAQKNAKFAENITLLRGDSFELLGDLLANLKGKIWLYFDPPFESRSGFEAVYQKIITLLENADTSSLEGFIFEQESSFLSPETIKEFHKSKGKKFGKTSLSFYMKSS